MSRQCDPAVTDHTSICNVHHGGLCNCRRRCDPVGAVEIAARLKVKRRTVDQWRQRGIGFPEPRWLVGGRPAWNYDDVEAWSKARHHVPCQE